jgi:hypothetical protein
LLQEVLSADFSSHYEDEHCPVIEVGCLVWMSRLICIALILSLPEELMASSNYGLFVNRWQVGESVEKRFQVLSRLCSTHRLLA